MSDRPATFRRWHGWLTAVRLVLLSLVMPLPAPALADGAGQQAYEYLQTYAALGLHRAGTEGERRAAAWLEGELRRAGLRVEAQDYAYNGYFPEQWSLSLDGFEPASFPLYYAGYTGPQGVQAELVWVGTGSAAEFARQPVAGRIVVAELPLLLNFVAVGLEGLRARAREQGAAALVLAIQGPLNEIVAQNVEPSEGLCHLPTLLVGKQDGRRLAAAAGRQARLRLLGRYEGGRVFRESRSPQLARSRNLLAWIEGRGEGVIVIAQPYTGWFATAAERGGPLGVQLALMRQFADRFRERPPAQSLLFLATAGHELGRLGIKQFLRQNAALLPRITAVIHTGDGAAAHHDVEVQGRVVRGPLADPNRYFFVSNNPLLFGLGETALVAAGLAMPPASTSLLDFGDQSETARAGLPTLAITGAHLWFHTPSDTPDKTSPALLAPLVDAYAQTIEQLLAVEPARLRALEFPLPSSPAPASCPGEALPAEDPLAAAGTPADGGGGVFAAWLLVLGAWLRRGRPALLLALAACQGGTGTVPSLPPAPPEPPGPVAPPPSTPPSPLEIRAVEPALIQQLALAAASGGLPDQDCRARGYIDQRLPLSGSRVQGYASASYRLLRPARIDTGRRLPLYVEINNLYEGAGVSKPAYPEAACALGWIYLAPGMTDAPGYVGMNGWSLELHYLQVLETVLASQPVDPARVYIGGGSKGAIAGLGMAFRYPDLFAGALGDSGTYDQGQRAALGALLAAAGPLASTGTLGTLSVPLAVLGGDPLDLPWNYDQQSAYQLASDPLPHADQHALGWPQYAALGHPVEQWTPFNAQALPLVLLGGGADPIAPWALSSAPFSAHLAGLGYRQRSSFYPDGGHEVSKDLYPEALAALRWLGEQRKAEPAVIAYQSADLVNPERADHPWPYYAQAGAYEGQSLPMQASRHDRVGGLVLLDPWRYRLRLGFAAGPGGVQTWRGRVWLEQAGESGGIRAAGGADDGLGLAENGLLAGSTAAEGSFSQRLGAFLSGIPWGGDPVALLAALRDLNGTPGGLQTGLSRRQWLEPGDRQTLSADGLLELALVTGDGATGDPWDLIALEIEAAADAALCLEFPDAGLGRRCLPLATLRQAEKSWPPAPGSPLPRAMPRTLDLPLPGATGFLRLQILQSQEWWWSQGRLARDPVANAGHLWLRNLAGTRLELDRLGFDPGRPLTLRVTGADDYTGDHVLWLQADWRAWQAGGGLLCRDGLPLPPPQPEGGRLRIPLGTLRDRSTELQLGACGPDAPAAPPLSWQPAPPLGSTELGIEGGGRKQPLPP